MAICRLEQKKVNHPVCPAHSLLSLYHFSRGQKLIFNEKATSVRDGCFDPIVPMLVYEVFPLCQYVPTAGQCQYGQSARKPLFAYKADGEDPVP